MTKMVKIARIGAPSFHQISPRKGRESALEGGSGVEALPDDDGNSVRGFVHRRSRRPL